MKYGIQLYSIRDIAMKDFEQAVEKVANMGYKMIEFAGFFGRTADEVNKLLADNGVELWGTHSSFDDLVNNFDETVAFHKAIGNKNYIIPSYDFSTKEKIDGFVELVNKYQPLLEKEGIRLAFHNHSYEFRPNDDGMIPWESIINRTSLYLEIDTYWAFDGGLDPVQSLEEYKDRLICIHLKDGFKGGKGIPLGKGEAPVKAVHAKAVELGLPIIVESETLTPSGEDECRTCFEYLMAL